MKLFFRPFPLVDPFVTDLNHINSSTSKKDLAYILLFYELLHNYGEKFHNSHIFIYNDLIPCSPSPSRRKRGG